MFNTHFLRPSSTISDFELVKGIALIRKASDIGGFHWVMVWELSDYFNIHPNRIRSKVRRASKRKLVDGCICGCRGDFELLPAGEQMLKDKL